MEERQKFSSHTSYGKILIASIFILSGALLFARNMGWISYELFDILVSWQTLLIIIGVYTIAHRHYIGGSIVLLIGIYFLIGGLSWLPENSQAMIWPLVLVLAGILFLIKGKRNKEWDNRRRFVKMQREHWNKRRMHGKMESESEANEFSAENNAKNQQCESENGFLRSNNVFGTVRHVMLDELFKGADIHTSFGGTTIDLRHTHIAPGETYIDLDCSWGGIELYIPADWKVIIKCNAFFGGCDDKRWQKSNVNQECVLILRGNISFGGVEIKD